MSSQDTRVSFVIYGLCHENTLPSDGTFFYTVITKHHSVFSLFHFEASFSQTIARDHLVITFLYLNDTFGYDLRHNYPLFKLGLLAFGPRHKQIHGDCVLCPLGIVAVPVGEGIHVAKKD